MYAGEVLEGGDAGDGGLCHGFAVVGDVEGAADVEAAACGITAFATQVAAVAQVCIQVPEGCGGSASLAGGGGVFEDGGKLCR